MRAVYAQAVLGNELVVRALQHGASAFDRRSSNSRGLKNGTMAVHVLLSEGAKVSASVTRMA